MEFEPVFPLLSLPEDIHYYLIECITEPSSFLALSRVNWYFSTLCNRLATVKRRHFTVKVEKQIGSWDELWRELSLLSLPTPYSLLPLLLLPSSYLYPTPYSLLSTHPVILQIETLPNGSGAVIGLQEDNIVFLIDFPTGLYKWCYPTGIVAVSATLKEGRLTSVATVYNKDGSVHHTHDYGP